MRSAIHKQRWFALACGLVLLLNFLAVNPAQADGKVFAPVASVAPVAMPDQEALLHFDSTAQMQTLVIRTRFIAEGDRFAWVVPVPTEPQVFPATHGLFTTLRSSFSPKIIDDTPNLLAFCLVLMFIPAICLSREVMPKGVSLFGVLLVIVSLAGLASLFLPSLGAPRGQIIALNDGSSVQVLSRTTVGSFDTVTLTGSDARDLLDWLDREGFHTPDGIEPVVADYVRDGWVFVAAKLTRDDTTGTTAQPHPLGLRFSTPRAVYPLRLTAVGNPPLDLSLYVFADERASLPGMQAEYCAAVSILAADDDTTRLHAHDADEGRLYIGHPLLIDLVGKSTVATRLTGTLTPQQMAKDATLEWEPFQPTWPVFHSRQAARRWQANLAGIGLVIVATMLALVHRNGKLTQPRWQAFAAAVCVLAVAVMVIVPRLFIQSRDTVETSIRDLMLTYMQTSVVEHAVSSLRDDMLAGKVPDDLVASFHERLNLRRRSDLNPFTGRPFAMEDSPGNMVVEVRDGHLWVTCYDMLARPSVFTTAAPPD